MLWSLPQKLGAREDLVNAIDQSPTEFREHGQERWTVKKWVHPGLAIVVTVVLAGPGRSRQGRPERDAAKSPLRSSTLRSSPSDASARSDDDGRLSGIKSAEEARETSKPANTEYGFTAAPGVDKAEKPQAGNKSADASRKGRKHKGLGKGKKQGRSSQVVSE